MQNKLLLIIFLLFSTEAFAQEAIKPRPSPTSIVTMKYEDTYVKITYSQPHRRGRQVFGSLVPYNQVWRTGANEATEMTTTGNLIIKDKVLPAGTYSIFTIPEEHKWTVIISAQVGLWGAYNYNEKFDVMRVDLPVLSTRNDVVWEPFTIEFEQKNDEADLVMLWDQTRVNIPIKFVTKH
ncbi:MAG: DUF2911 domain-containing protein [Candidatus Cyclobacteriaceae bacterium M2_1C_046]